MRLAVDPQPNEPPMDNIARLTQVQQEQRPPLYSDDALALRFAERHAGELRYVATWSRWMHWNGARWQPDDTLATFDRVRVICREAAAECDDDEKIGKELASAKTVSAVERMAKADRRHAITIEQWDSDDFLLNTKQEVEHDNI